MGIQYATQVIDKKLQHKQPKNLPILEKAHYRRGMCYLDIGNLEAAEQDFLVSCDMAKKADRKNTAAEQGMALIKQKHKLNKQRERDMAAKMMRKDPNQKSEEAKEAEIIEEILTHQPEQLPSTFEGLLLHYLKVYLFSIQLCGIGVMAIYLFELFFGKVHPEPKK